MWVFRIRNHLYSGKYINHINMSRKLHLIRQKVESICYGMLRFSDGSVRTSMEVRALSNNGSRLSCIIKDNTQTTSLLHRQVNLIQKKDNDYLYISGEVDDEVKAKDKTISLKINKAFWFTRKQKGNSVWLQEKFIYDMDEIEKAS